MAPPRCAAIFIRQNELKNNKTRPDRLDEGVIHSSRSVGFTGWIGGVAVFNRALRAYELRALSTLRQLLVIAAAAVP